MKHTHSGFSLVELSIVIVIIGLIVGGILGGTSLQRASQVRAALTDAQGYGMAMKQFKDQYGELPGDFAGATRVWGRADGGSPVTSNCAAPTSNASTGKASCNGNGDGIIDSNTENFRSWQHLSAAGLITGNYTGVNAGSTVYHSVPGSNVPSGAIKNTGYWLYSWGYIAAGGTSLFEGMYNNVMTFGAATTTSWPSGGVLSGKEAYEIDRKADDSYPATGGIRARPNTQLSTCSSTDAVTTARYIRTSPAGAGCPLYFMPEFLGISDK